MTPYMKWRTRNVQNTALCREVAAAVATVSLLSRALHLVHIKAFVSILIWGAKVHIFMKATKFDEISQFCFDAKRKLGEFHHIFVAFLEKIKFNNNRLSIFLLLFLFLIPPKFLGEEIPSWPPPNENFAYIL